jgi:1,4-dihydroxy-2-naphthoate octaprenyltransferase
MSEVVAPDLVPDDRLRTATILAEVPSISAEQWATASPLMRWLVATRAAVLVLTFSSAAFGGLVAVHGAVARGTAFDVFAWLACCVGLILAHATNNLLNDLTDTRQGVDDGNYFRMRYGTHVLQHGFVDQRGMWGYILITGLTALAIGLGLLWYAGPTLLVPMVAGAFCLLFYTWPLKKWGLGEIAVLLVWGPLMVCGTVLAAGGSVDAGTVAAGTLFGIGPTLVIFGKHIDKLAFDEAKGVLTLPVRLGEARSRRWVVVITLAQYPAVLALVVTGTLPWPALLVLASLPGAGRLVRMYRQPRPETCPPDWPETAWPLWFVAAAFVHARETGLLLLAGMVAAVALAAL